MFDEDWFEEKLRQLDADINGDIDIRKRVKEIVSTYQLKGGLKGDIDYYENIIFPTGYYGNRN